VFRTIVVAVDVDADIMGGSRSSLDLKRRKAKERGEATCDSGDPFKILRLMYGDFCDSEVGLAVTFTVT
jgi:hypothetical protein